MSDSACQEPFKKPTIECASDGAESNTPSSTNDDPLQKAPNKPKKKTDKPLVDVPLPYTEPEWGGIPPPNYDLEVIKNGTSVSMINIRASCLVFGRLDVCDVVFEHPSVSRYHAIVQYCKGDDTHPKGFYLFDLGSTHGTYLNKERISKNIYYKLKVGYILKFGGSSRLHIFQGPEEEEVEKVVEKKVEEVECSWGMGEDANEEEDLTENPFALSTPNEDLYLEDPKKTLRGWFEREGYEVEYNVEEKGFRTFVCTVRLPVDTATGDYLPVEASVAGKKKEAVVACALEACRTLDRMGLLRQSHHEGRQRKKNKWEENDFYDSDEDTFFDRTGDIEKRREMRKRMSDRKSKAENFETLQAKLAVIVEEIDTIEKKLAACAARNSSHSGDSLVDTLESYMSSLVESADTPTDKFQKRRLKFRLIEAEKERGQLEKMLNIARPAKLPPAGKHPGIIGKRLKKKVTLPVAAAISKHSVKSSENDQDIEEMESDTEMNDTETNTQTDKEIDTVRCSDAPLGAADRNTEQMDVDKEPKKYGLVLPNAEKVTVSDVKIITKESDPPKSEFDKQTTNLEQDVEDVITEKELKVKISRKQCKKDNKNQKGNIDIYKTTNSEYSTWVPPNNQSGDGMTHLNAKYGY